MREENLLFIEAIRLYRKEGIKAFPNPLVAADRKIESKSPDSLNSDEFDDELKKLTNMRLAIKAKFLAKDCESEVGLPGKIINEISDAEKFQCHHPDVFASAYDYVLLTLKNDSFPKFLKSKQ